MSKIILFSESNDAKIGVEMNLFFNSWKATCWLFPHLKDLFFLVNSVKTAAVLE